jgi:hypothetical protein
MKPPENRTAAPEGTAVDDRAAKHDCQRATVKADLEQLARWLDMAIVMHRMAATDPAEFQRLGLWLQRMRRAIK